MRRSWQWMGVVVVCASLAACGRQAAPTVERSGSVVSAQAVFSNWPVLRSGSSGRDVVTAQYLLRERGYTLSVDGAFGSGTQSAVVSFQRAQGLAADGVVGADTWEKLVKTVRQGDSNNAVRAVQDQLAGEYGYGVSVDGVFGSGTQSAVVSFQRSRGLSADGIVGLNTWNALVTGGSAGGSAASLASQILNSGRITLGTSSSTPGGNPRQTMIDTANGLPAKAGCSYSASCGATVSLKANMLRGMLSVASKYTLYITSTTGGVHSSTSYHYKGTAFDVGSVNGVVVNGDSSLNRAAMQACRDAGAVEVLGPSNRADHQDHIHCAWAP